MMQIMRFYNPWGTRRKILNGKEAGHMVDQIKGFVSQNQCYKLLANMLVLKKMADNF